MLCQSTVCAEMIKEYKSKCELSLVMDIVQVLAFNVWILAMILMIVSWDRLVKWRYTTRKDGIW